METAAIQNRDQAGDEVAMVPFSARHLPGAHKLSLDLRWPYRLDDWAFAIELGQGFVLERQLSLIHI